VTAVYLAAVVYGPVTLIGSFAAAALLHHIPQPAAKDRP
jgi:uncharacterized membrane protein YfcA